MGKALTFLAGAAAGAAAAYFLDPQGGARRRNQTKDKTVSTVKSSASDLAGTARPAANKAQGVVHAATPPTPGNGAHDDITLARKVETEIFRSPDAPKSGVSVNVENGVVFLRGTVDDQAWIDRLGTDARQVQGVKEVRNLLHRPGTPTPVAPATR